MSDQTSHLNSDKKGNLSIDSPKKKFKIIVAGVDET